MRARSAALGLALVLVGCIQAAERGIEDARNGSAPQESVNANGTPVTTPEPTSATPTPIGPPAPTPTSTTPPEAPTPPLVTPPPPDPTPVTTPVPTPTPPPTVTPTPPPPPTSTPTPTPTPTPAPQAWPHEGSHVSYQIDSGNSIPDGSGYTRTFANATWTFTNGDWRGTCDAHTLSWYSFATPQWNNSTSHVVYDAAHPPHWPLLDTKTPPAVGQTVTAWYLDGCAINSNGFDLQYRGTGSLSVPGHASALATHVATSPNDGVPRDHRTEWLQGSGLVVYAHMQWHYSHASADLTSTDAPS